MGELLIRVTARAHADEITGERDGVLQVRVRAPPAEGRANAAVCRLIARRVGTRPSAVTLVRGASSREKLIRVEGMDSAQLRRALR